MDENLHGLDDKLLGLVNKIRSSSERIRQDEFREHTCFISYSEYTTLLYFIKVKREHLILDIPNKKSKDVIEVLNLKNEVFI